MRTPNKDLLEARFYTGGFYFRTEIVIQADVNLLYPRDALLGHLEQYISQSRHAPPTFSCQGHDVHPQRPRHFKRSNDVARIAARTDS